MLSIPFINRVNDLKFLNRYKQEVGRGNHAIFITGKSGLGKSKLTGKFIDDCLFDEIPSIKVEINQRKTDNYDSGYYLRRIGKSINAISKSSQIESIGTFCRKFNSKTLTERLSEAIKSDFIELLPVGKKTAEEISNRLFGTTKYDDEIIFESAHAEILNLLHDYIKEQVKKVSVILNIENIQSIDDYSLSSVLSIMNESLGSVFIFEYTENDKDSLGLNYLIGKLNFPDDKISVYELPPIEINEIIDGLQQFPELGMDILNKSHTTWDGNLRPLTDILVKLKYSHGNIIPNSISMSNATKQNIESLNTSDLFLLTVIFTHQEPVPISFLHYLNNFNEAFKLIVDIDKSINTLIERALLKRTGDNLELELAHDTISSIISTFEPSVRFSTIALKFWFTLYDKGNNTVDLQIARSIRLFRTLYFASLLNYDSKIYSLINDIGRQAIQTSSPKQILIYLLKIKAKIEAAIAGGKGVTRLREINKLIVEIFYNVGLYVEAFNLVSEFDNPDKSIIALKAVLLIETAQHEKAYAMCTNTSIVSEEDKAGFRTLMLVVEILALFAMNRTGECRSLFEQYEPKPEVRNTLEYGFLLRTSELFYSTRRTIKFLNKSIDHFILYGANIQAAYSRNNYAVHLAILGNLDMARTAAEEAANQLAEISIERHTILNNIGCILLSAGNLSNEVEVLFRQALITAELDSEKIAIYSNYLALMDWRNDKDLSLKLISDLESVVQRAAYLDEGILLIAFYNIYRFYKDRDQTLVANSYYNKCVNLYEEGDSLWDFRLKGLPISENDENYYSAHLSRGINFLCHWNIEFDSRLMRY